jgi:hypothetical protein
MSRSLVAMIADLFGYDRQAWVIGALVALMVAGTMVALGALVLFRREGRRHHRRGTAEGPAEPDP